MISPLPLPELAEDEYTLDEWYDLTGFQRFWWWIFQILWFIFGWVILILVAVFIYFAFKESWKVDSLERNYHG